MARRRKKLKPEQLKSGLEVSALKTLQALQTKKNFFYDYEKERLEYVKTGYYVPDFVITFPNSDHKRYIEMKGYLRREDKQKLELIRRQHPDLDLRIVFQQNKKFSKTSNFTYVDWANKHGFIVSTGTIPPEWLTIL